MEYIATYIISEFPNTLRILEKFVPALIALLALWITAWIQIGQGRIAKIKLKLDLFNQRVGLFDVLDAINRAYAAAKGDEWVGEYLSNMREATKELQRFRLLFPPNIGSRVDEIVDAWHDFTTLKAGGESIRKPSPEWSAHLHERRALWEKIGEKNNALRTEIEKVIRVDWEG